MRRCPCLRALPALLVFAILLLPAPARAMHITEGLLPLPVALFWFALALPFVAVGVYGITRRKQLSPSYMPLLGIFGAAVFVFIVLLITDIAGVTDVFPFVNK